MQSLGDEIIVATPERIAFRYEIAGIGSRFLAQAIDCPIIAALVLGAALLSLGVGRLSAPIGLLVFTLLSFVIMFGYFWLAEGLTGGRTPGKSALRLRVVGIMGQPASSSQIAIRNVIRIVDFLPVLYGLGIIGLFANGRGQRLGDLAAGTTVIRERPQTRLKDLPSPASASPAPSAPPPDPIPIDDGLKRFLVAYAGRRSTLTLEQREKLASLAEPALSRAAPALVRDRGLLAAMDSLADRVR